MSALKYWVWLAECRGVSNQAVLALLRHFGSPEDVFYADTGEILLTEGITREQAKALEDHKLDKADKILADCQRLGLRILTIQDAEYPGRLQNIYDPPCLLYVKGRLPAIDEEAAVAVVGTRDCTPYGVACAEKLGYGLASGGAVVVSGLAKGIDAAAMSGALQAGYPTVGVLGTGVDVVYPACNKALFAQVEQNGCLLSEFLPGTRAFKWNFPRRNRIISGLSVGVVIVEAPERSGALHTARAALEQSRDLYAVPGNVDLPSFAGSNQLLREGACPVCCGWDVMSEYTSLFPDKIRKVHFRAEGTSPAAEPTPRQTIKKKEPKQPERKKDIDNTPAAAYIDLNTALQGLPEQERAIVSCLTEGEKLVDEVIAATGIPSGQFLRQLTMLELKGLIVRLPGNRLALRK